MITHTTIFGFLIAEPTTAITDFILAALCLVFYFRFAANNKEDGSFYWKRFFLFMGISTLVGGITHAFLENHNTNMYSFFWLSMQLLSGLSVLYSQIATIHSIPNPNIPLYRTMKTSLLLSRIQFVLFAVAVLLFRNFIVVVTNSTVGFLMVLYIHALSGRKYGNRASAWIALGIMVSFLTAIIYTLKISINQWFNFKDIAHVIMMISISFIFYGAVLSFDKDEKKASVKMN
jgi:hypothetical protein